MRMMMKSVPLLVYMMVLLVSVLVCMITTTTAKTTTTTAKPTTTTAKPTTTTAKPTTTTAKPTTTTAKTTTTTARPTTTDSPGSNLQGKMFTLSRYGGGISLYPPSSPSPSSFTWTPSSFPFSSSSPSTSPFLSTTPSSSPGVSVCLRYVTEEFDYQPIFTLNPYGPSRLTLRNRRFGRYDLSISNSLSFSTFRNLWAIRYDFWNSVCVTVDTTKGVAQIFRGGAISIRRRLPIKYLWTGKPVIDISGFDGQVTDVQVWNYPLRYRDIYNYMSYGYYGSYHGSVLTWSQISYSLRGDALLEDTYDSQESRPIKRRDREHGRMGEKRGKKFFTNREQQDRKRERL